MPRWTRPIPEAPAEPGAVGNGHKSKGEKAISLQLSEERLRRLTKQNERLDLETKVRQGTLVELASIKRDVLEANGIVKARLLSLPSRISGELSAMTDPRLIRTFLTTEITKALNELAYEHRNDL